jgi:phosphomannomutase
MARIQQGTVLLIKNEEQNAVVRSLHESGKYEELQACMEPRIAFGTAGLRAEMGPGFARMNELVVLQTCQGTEPYL